MRNLHERTLLDNLDALALDRLAQQTGIENSYTKKIHGPQLLASLLLLINQRQTSLNDWASLYSALAGVTVSKQALALKFDARHGAFFEAALQAQLARTLRPEESTVVAECPLLAPFRRVLVEDSTCFSLPDHLHRLFPSSYAAGAAKATARLQWLHDLTHERLLAFDVQSYRDNDQKHAPAVLAHIKAGDLLLRDLGYFASAVFEALDQRGAFYISRLHYRTHVLDASSGAVLDLVEMIDPKHGRTYLDLEVLLGAERRVPVRLVGVRLPEEVVAARRRRAREAARKDKRRGYSKRYAAWLAWSFFVTNVPSSMVPREQILGLYRLRWRIEMIFKGLKHVLGVGRLFLVRGMSHQRLRLSLMGVLLYALLVVWPYYRLLSVQVHRWGHRLSLLKLMQWLRMHLMWVLLSASVELFAEQVARHCSYERRRKRKNYIELCEQASFP